MKLFIQRFPKIISVSSIFFRYILATHWQRKWQQKLPHPEPFPAGMGDNHLRFQFLDLAQCLLELIEAEHCRVGHQKAHHNDSCHIVPQHRGAGIGGPGEEGHQRQGQSHKDGQNVGRDLVPGHLLQDLHDDVGQHHQHADGEHKCRDVHSKGIVESTRYNAQTIASIFGMEAQVDSMFTDFQPRIDALKAVLNRRNVLLGMYNSNALGLMGTASQLNMIVKELGVNNLSESVGEVEKATHGEEASSETIITLNPEYMFILDRSTATGASDEGVMGAREVIENELIQELDVYKNGRIVYFIDHANVWYTSTGGVQALDTMLADLEGALLNETSR